MATPVSGQMTFLIHGLVPKDELVCPPLDIEASIQISDELIGIYQSRIDALINQLGKNILLEFDPIKEFCPNCFFDTARGRSTGIPRPGGPRPFKRGRQCPFCKGRGFLETPCVRCIKALLQWNPREIRNYGLSVELHSGIVRIKTFLTEADDISRAKTIIVNSDIQDQMKLRVKRLMSVIPTGLREDRYCISFWELIDD